MKRIFFFFAFVVVAFTSGAQVATMEIIEPIPGLCNPTKVYAILPMLGGQTKAVCTISNVDIQKKLNEEVTLLKDSTGYNDKGMVSIIVNCEGKAVRCEIDNKTKHPELDRQIVAIFATMSQWKPAKIKNKPVDAVVLISFEIKNAQIVIN